MVDDNCSHSPKFASLNPSGWLVESSEIAADGGLGVDSHPGRILIPWDSISSASASLISAGSILLLNVSQSSI